MKFAAFALALVGLTAFFSGAVSLDCSNVVEIIRQGQADYVGNVTIYPTSNVRGWVFSQTYDTAPTFMGAWDAIITYDSTGPRATVYNNSVETGNVDANQPLNFRFKVAHSRYDPAPQLTSMTFQGVELCR